MDTDELHAALLTLGDLLEAQGLTEDLVLIGGGALLLSGISLRPTKDLDAVGRQEGGRLVRAEPFPLHLTAAVQATASAHGLAEDWLNPGPASLMDLGLPDGFFGRTTAMEFSGLTVRLASRIDQIFFKVYAAADHWPRQTKHVADLKTLGATAEELRAAAVWCRTHDPSPGFRDVLLLPLLASLGVDCPDV